MGRNLNPTDINGDTEEAALNRAALAQLFSADPARTYLREGDTLQTGTGDEITLTHSLINIPKFNPRTRKVEPHYYVFSDTPSSRLGRGNFGSVFKILGSIQLNPDHTLTHYKPHQPNKKRVVKKSHPLNGSVQAVASTINDLINESNLQRRLISTHTKGPQIGYASGSSHQPQPIGFIVSAELRQQPLHDLLKSDQQNPLLTVEKRIQLTKNLIRALNEQLQDNRIVHCDIKPENIMVDVNTLEVHFIDFGLALDFETAEQLSSIRGTASYIAPETILDYQNSSESDIYSLGAVIAEVWGAKPLATPDMVGRLNPIEYITNMHRAIRAGNTQTPLVNLFGRITDAELSKDEKKTVKNTIKKLMAHDPNDRLHPDHAHRIFSHLEIGKKTQDFRLTAQAKQAYAVGMRAYRELHDTRLQQQKNSFTRMLKAVAKIDSVADNELAIRTYLSALGVNSFQTAEIAESPNKKERIKNTALNIIEDFIKNIETLLLFNQVAEINLPNTKTETDARLLNSVNMLFAEVNYLWHKEKKTSVTFDSLAQLNTHFSDTLPRLKAYCATIASHLKDATQKPKQHTKIDLYNQIVLKLTQPAAKDQPELNKLSQDLRTAIQYYLQKTMSKKNLKKNDRAGSIERLNEITELLSAIERASSVDELVRDINTQLHGFSRVGLFGSTLKSAVSSALNANVPPKPKAPK